MPKQVSKDIGERLDDNTIPEPNTGCWLWAGAATGAGYGCLSIGHRSFSTHRLQWERFNGSIPKGLFVCHKCDTPACINPDHLFLGTNQDNQNDSVSKGKNNPSIGEDASAAKITEDQVRTIFHDNRNQHEIALDYNISACHVSEIKNGKTWRHLGLGSAPKREDWHDDRKGENNHNSKLTNVQVSAIFSDPSRQCDIAKEYNINRNTVWLIKSNRIWKHLNLKEPASC